MNIGEIAKMAGVSRAAVSRYFNKGYISEEKKEAIQRVVEATGYRPSAQAQTLRTKKTKMIGVILPKITSESIGGMVGGISSVINESDYQMLLANTQNTPVRELEYLSIFNEKQVDGVIFIATVFTKKHLEALNHMKVPVVILGQRLEGYNCYYHNDYQSEYEMTKMFLEKGRKKLGYIGVTLEDKAAGAARYQGFCDALKEYGAEENADNFVIADFTMESGHEKAKELLEKNRNLDGILCATDTIAVGAMLYLKEEKIKIPEEIAMAGNGNSALAKVTSPSLTTISHHYRDCGVLGARKMMDILENKDAEIAEVELDSSQVWHDSFCGE
ncbi:MAG: LacI family DNA-binding transcriptional regulator [Lachnospiraceae bacterium]|nr:LacI family DNA-binding transcriptional regulator [Lachnospiraceae bacterium]MDD3615452.1 LacI family DNA-binding transcriptional regulator [Lachnospiraceae bacterium]